MQDIRGKEIKIGDLVVTSHKSQRRGAYQGVEIREVIGFTPKQIRTIKPEDKSKEKPKYSWQHYERLHMPDAVVILESAPEIMEEQTQMGMGV